MRGLIGFTLCLFLGSAAAVGGDPHVSIADFEDETVLKKIKCTNGKIEIASLSGLPPSRWLHWTVPGGDPKSWITIKTVPADIRSYRRLRFRARIDRKTKDVVMARLRSDQGCLTKDLELTVGEWKEVEILLPDMQLVGNLDPEGIYGFRLVVESPTGFELDIDDIELSEEPGGYRATIKEQLTEVFGKKRARKVRSDTTKHFAIHSDSRAVGKKFKAAMETGHDFVAESLGIDGMPGRLPVFVFQNRKLLGEYLMRTGKSKAVAMSTEGWGSGRFFATYYRAPMTGETIGNLARCIFKRAFGGGGGDWLSQGAVQYVSERWQKRSITTLFAPRLRTGDMVPLSELFVAKEVWDLESAAGGARTVLVLKLQVGAFFEYLLRGPPGKEMPHLLHDLAGVKTDGKERLKEIEKILGAKANAIEAAWRKWTPKD